MKFATWNVNSLKVRLQQTLDWLESSQTDVLCLQELKLPDDKFPLDAFQELGMHAVWAGQKTYNGVAIISRQPLVDIQRNIPGFDDPQQRIIAGTLESPLGSIRIVSAYCPNGQSLDSDKYQYKLGWYRALNSWLAGEIERYPLTAVLGDYNIAPTDDDVHDPAKWKDDVLVSEPEREAFRALLDLGFVDSFRAFGQEPATFTWWDYRRFAFRRNAGLRIDHILLSQQLMPACAACTVDITPRRNDQPSDHAPVVATLTMNA